MTGKNLDLHNPLEEHSILRSIIQSFVQKEIEPQAEEFDKKEQFNLELFRKLGSIGLLGITAPEEYGGSGLGPVSAVIAHEELSYSDPGFCLAFLAHSMLCVNNLVANASEEQKAKYLPKLCSGEWVGAMGMSEPGAGTDVLGMTTSAEESDEGFEINGRKMWITNGTIDEDKTPCDVLLLYARTGTNEKGQAEISTFIVEKIDKGFSVGQKINGKTGMRASNTAELCLDKVKLGKSRLVGNTGESMSHMMRNLEIERVTLAAMALGIAKRSLDVMVRYSTERKAFSSPLSSFGQIQSHIANSYAEYSAARAYVYETARHIGVSGSGRRLNSDGVKLIAAPAAKRIADRAMQVLGGYGYVSEYVVERLWRDAKLLEIGGGTLEAHEKNITRDLVKDL